MPDPERLIYRSILISLSILIAGILALIRIKKIHHFYFPFIISIWAGCLNEIFGIFMWKNGQPVALNNNIYVLAQAVLLIVFFKNAGIFENSFKFFYFLISAIFLFWSWENILRDKIYEVSSWFRIVYSYILVLLSITGINKLVISDPGGHPEIQNFHFFKNPFLLICLGFIIFFHYCPTKISNNIAVTFTG